MQASMDPIEILIQRIRYLPKELNSTLTEIERQQTSVRQMAQRSAVGSAERATHLVQVWVFEAIKALALLKFDKYDQVLQGERIVSKIIADDRLIVHGEICAVLHECLLAQRDMDGLCTLWERHIALAEKRSGGKQLVEENIALLRTYAISRQMQKLYRQAMKVHKLTGNREHLQWALVSMAEYVRSIPGDGESQTAAQRNMVLSIMSNMLDKMLKELSDSKDVEERASSELVLYFSRVLIDNERFDDAKRLLLDAANIAKLEQFDAYLEGRATQLARLLQKSGFTRESNAVYQLLLTEHNADEWQWWLSYLDTLPVQHPSSGDLPSDGDSATVTVQWTEGVTKDLPYSGFHPIDFIKSTQDKNSSLRGPFLAELELNWRKDGSVDASLLNSYYARFGHKMVCFADLLRYLPKQSDSDVVNPLLELLKGTMEGEQSKSRSQTDQFRFEINFHKFHHVLVVESAEANTETIRMLYGRYNEAKKLNTGLATDFQLTDPFLQLIVHKCLRTVKPAEQPSNDLLLEVAALLEDGIKLSPSNFQLRFLAIRVYILLGAMQTAVTHFKSLDVKNVQFESVAYIVYYDLLRFGQWQSLRSLSHGAAAFEQEHEEHTGNMVFESLSHGNFTSVTEFFKFADMIDRSFAAKQAHTDSICFSLMDNLTPYSQRFSLFANNGHYLRLKLLNRESDWEKNLSFNEDLDMVDSLGRGDDILERFILPDAVQQNRYRIENMRNRMKAVLAIGAMTEASFLVMEEARLEKLRKQNEKEEKRRQKKQQRKGGAKQKQQQQQQSSATQKDDLNMKEKIARLRQQLSSCTIANDDGSDDTQLSAAWKVTDYAIKETIPSILSFCESDRTNMTEAAANLFSAMDKWIAQVADFLPTLNYIDQAESNEHIDLDNIARFSDLLFNHLLWWTCIAQTAVFVLRTKKPASKPKGVPTDFVEKFKSQLLAKLNAATVWLESSTSTALNNHYSKSETATNLIPDADNVHEGKTLKKVKSGVSSMIDYVRNGANNLQLEVKALSSSW